MFKVDMSGKSIIGKISHLRFCEMFNNWNTNSGVADTRKSFLEGSAFQSGPIEKTMIELEEFEFKSLYLLHSLIFKFPKKMCSWEASL